MKKKFQIIVIFLLSFFFTTPFVYSQNNSGQNNMNSNNTNMNSDTTEYHSMDYYRYAKKNIIEDKAPDKNYKGKWVDSSKTATSKNEGMVNDKTNRNNDKNDKMMNKTKTKKDNTMHKGKKKMNNMKNQMKSDTSKGY